MFFLNIYYIEGCGFSSSCRLNNVIEYCLVLVINSPRASAKFQSSFINLRISKWRIKLSASYLLSATAFCIPILVIKMINIYVYRLGNILTYEWSLWIWLSNVGNWSCFQLTARQALVAWIYKMNMETARQSLILYTYVLKICTFIILLVKILNLR
jgi:hypothetical protein